MKKMILVTGGARSGKSQFAQELALGFPGAKAYLATAQILDEEMAERIRRHKLSRPPEWETLEEPLRVPECIEEKEKHYGLILVDCLTLWITNLMLAGISESGILREGNRLMESARRAKCSMILVGNEVGMGIVPDNPQARAFRDVSGLVQQKVAREADEVFFMVSGIGMKVKSRQ